MSITGPPGPQGPPGPPGHGAMVSSCCKTGCFNETINITEQMLRNTLYLQFILFLPSGYGYIKQHLSTRCT